MAYEEKALQVGNVFYDEVISEYEERLERIMDTCAILCAKEEKMTSSKEKELERFFRNMYENIGNDFPELPIRDQLSMTVEACNAMGGADPRVRMLRRISEQKEKKNSKEAI